MTVTVVDQQGKPLEGVVIMVANGPVSVPDVAALTGADGVGSLGHLSEPGSYTLLLAYKQQQRQKTIQVRPGGAVTLSF